MNQDDGQLVKRTVRTVAVMLAGCAILLGTLSSAAVLVTSRAVGPRDDVAGSPSGGDATNAAKAGKGARS